MEWAWGDMRMTSETSEHEEGRPQVHVILTPVEGEESCHTHVLTKSIETTG